MECEVDRKEFLAAVKTCRPVANGKVIAAYNCIRLEFKGDTCLLQASNGHVAIQLKVPIGGSMLVDFVCCVKADLLASVLSGPGGDKVTLLLGQDLQIKTANAKHKLLLVDASEFPKLPPVGNVLAKTTGSVLAGAIQRVAYACDEQSSRYALGGVLFDFTSHGWTLVGTDGRRLSLCSVTKEKYAKEMAPIVPVAACRFVSGLLSGSESEVTVGMADSGASVVFSNSELTYWARMLDGRFPAYRDVIPSSAEAESSTPASLLLNAMHEARIYTDKESRGVSFAFDEDKGLTLSVALANVGSAEIAVPARYDGQPLTIDLDPRLVAEFLAPLSAGKSVSMKFRKATDAALLEADGGDYQCVIMPLVID